MRMHMRRFTRLTNAFSKKVDNHRHAVALHYMYYNFARDSSEPESHSGQWHLAWQIMYGQLRKLLGYCRERDPLPGNAPARQHRKRCAKVAGILRGERL